MSSPAFYLGRKQKIFGPLTAADVEALRQNGQIENYSWIWTPQDQTWNPLDMAPPAPSVNVTSGVTVEPMPAPTQTRRTPEPVAIPVAQAPKAFKETRIAKAKGEAFRAILFDGRNAVTAWVSEASADGCEIRAMEQGSDPFFVQKANATIHLHEIATGRSTKISVSVTDVFRHEHHWVYKVRWNSVPAIFAPSRAA